MRFPSLVFHRQSLWLLLLLLLALVARLYFAAQLPHPGHGDPAFYFTIVESITSGRGLEIDYIWHYLTAPASVTHPGADYWMIFAAVLMSVPYFIFRSLFSILVLSSLVGVGIAFLAYRLSPTFTASKFAAFLAMVYLLFEPSLFGYSIAVDAPVYYVFFVMLALYLMIRAQETPQLFLWAGVVSGLAHLTRQDALLLVPTLLLVIFLSPHPFKTRLRWMGGAVGLYLLVLLPMLAYNLHHFGALLPPGPARVAFATNHEDVYVYSKELSLHSYLTLGWWAIFKQKVLIGLANLQIIYDRLGLFTLTFAGIAIAEAVFVKQRRPMWRKYLPILIFFSLEYTFYTLFATVVSTHGSFGKAVLTVVPFIILIALDAIERHIPAKPVMLLLVGLFTFPILLTTLPKVQGGLAFHTEINREMTALAETLETTIAPHETNEIIIMTRDPWEVHLTTGYRAIMIPYEELDVIYEVARRYGANYLLIPAPSRPALNDFKTIAETDPRFEFAVQVPNTILKLYRILPDAP